VVLTTGAQRPVAMLERTRFLLAVSARFGFALHAERPVIDLADPPRILPIDADPRDAVRLLGGAGQVHEDVAVVDSYGRCRGVARIGDLLQALAGLEHQRALALHPVTGLPGLPALVERLESEAPRGIGLIVPDLNGAALAGGFEAAVDGARRVARAVTDILPRFAGGSVAHGTGDDLVVLLDPADPPAFDAALRIALADRGAPRVTTTWLRDQGGEPRELARTLARLRTRPIPLPRPAAG
jgi:hypothetical protein